MKSSQAFKALSLIDFKQIQRDPMLRWLVALPLLLGVLVRWGLPLLAAALLERLAFDLEPYYTLLMSFLLLLLPGIIGMVFGFLLLDQRDDQTLSALQVTPLSMEGYLGYRIAIPMLLNVAVSWLVFLIASNVIEFDPIHLLFAIILAAPFGPLYAVFLATFAKNKVQGFALAKVVGVVLWPPVFAYFVQTHWQLAFGIVPTYWPVKFLWTTAAHGLAWPYFIVGILYQAALMFVLVRTFNKKLHRE